MVIVQIFFFKCRYESNMPHEKFSAQGALLVIIFFKEIHRLVISNINIIVYILFYMNCVLDDHGASLTSAANSIHLNLFSNNTVN